MAAVEASEAGYEIEKLLALHPKGFDLSLDRITRLLAALGNPQDRLPPVIHVAGTNGKGSATAFSRAILEAAGLSVHVHTSPHLVNWHERYRLGVKGGKGKLVSDPVLADAVRRVAEANGGEKITVFEILTAVTFVLFAEHPADVAIIEVGLGGRFDATNVIARPAVSVVMPISLDHQAYLGDRVELIAAEKAGIMKRGCPVVIGQQEEEAARDVLVSTAERLGCPMFVYGQDFMAHEEFGRLVYQDEGGLADLPLPKLPGRHQYANAAAAIRAVRAAGFDVSEAAIERGLAGGAGEQAVVADAVKALGQDVEQEAPDELVGAERHDLLPFGTGAAVVLVAEGHPGLVEVEEAAVRDGDAVGVAGEIGQHGLRSAEGALGIDDPVGPAQRREDRRGVRRLGRGEGRAAAGRRRRGRRWYAGGLGRVARRAHPRTGRRIDRRADDRA